MATAIANRPQFKAPTSFWRFFRCSIGLVSGTTKQANYLKSLSFTFGGELYRESYISTVLFGQFMLLDYGTMISRDIEYLYELSLMSSHLLTSLKLEDRKLEASNLGKLVGQKCPVHGQ